MIRMALGDYPRSDVTDARVATLQGIHDNDPETFRDINLRQEQIQLRDQDMLRREQRNLIKQGHNLEADPKVRRAVDQLRFAGIIPKTMKQGTSKFNEFTGVLRQGLKAAEADLKYSRPLKEEEVVNIGRIATEKVGGLGGYFFTHPFYQDVAEEKIPEGLRMQMLSKEPDLTDEEMRDTYMRLRMRQEYQQRYGKRGSK